MAPADSEARRALLPAGLRDGLPPLAAQRAAVVEHLLAAFDAHGYERVDPPLVEFEDTLLVSGVPGGPASGPEIFRLMDPLSQRMMGVRADMTIQVARIATTRLAAQPRPLRLSYAGDVLRVKGTQLRPERQFAQVGVELIGAPSVAADVEVVRLAADALAAIGVAELSIDLNAPPLVPAVLAGFGLSGAPGSPLRTALDRKDADAVIAAAGPAGTALGGLLAATGPARAALMILTTVELPEAARAQRARLAAVVSALLDSAPGLRLTVDPVENRGFEYHTGIGFTLFGRGVRGELGRGGRYLAGDGGAQGTGGEPATGFSLFMDTVLRAVPEPTPVARIFLPHGTALDQARALRDGGWVTVAGLEPAGDAGAEAARQGCSHVWRDGAIIEVETKS
jgi:ATP phosphoribosyltransferase regulatory subunit